MVGNKGCYGSIKSSNNKNRLLYAGHNKSFSPVALYWFLDVKEFNVVTLKIVN